jgi:hypothetical protein
MTFRCGIDLSWEIWEGVFGTTVRKPAALRRVTLDWEAQPVRSIALRMRRESGVFIK